MNRKISILVDNNSWIMPYANQLVDQLILKNYEAVLVRDQSLIEKGWINFMLGCINLVTADTLAKNEYNLVVHESDLPNGKGFAPMSWQILEGKARIPICLINASDAVDSGDIWLTDVIELDGTELNQKWRHKQGEKTVELCVNFVENYQNIHPLPQVQINEPIFYNKRTAVDSELDVNISIKEQFNLLRIVDNEKYPAFFYINGVKYILKLRQQEDN